MGPPETARDGLVLVCVGRTELGTVGNVGFGPGGTVTVKITRDTSAAQQCSW
jgi:hypothetical protein